MMQKILVLTDLHITAAGETIIGLDPLERLTAVLAAAQADHPDAAHLILTGDLTHHGTGAEYHRLKHALADLPWPVTYMLGNHDRRAPFRAAFPKAAVTDDGYVQTFHDLPGWRLICLDTLDDPAPPDRHSGILCQARMDWLRETLATTPDRAVVFLHHPPVVTGFDGMDAIRLRNDQDVLDLLAQFPCAVQLVAGHVHRNISGHAGHLPFVIFKSPCHQMPMKLGAPGSAHSVDEPGAYGILLLGDGGVVAHSNDVFASPRAVLADAGSK